MFKEIGFDVFIFKYLPKIMCAINFLNFVKSLAFFVRKKIYVQLKLKILGK